ncbi:AraC family transcriptional regulator (plasmid) [Ralstonia sp. 25C]|uniref:AraC family transcriptional regulator n=1 Tax=Ralstonia sp. 25C TaxID=3447363 RepID=UPI003F74C1A3
MEQCTFTAGVRSPGEPSIVHSHFDVRTQTHQQPLLAWRERVGHIIDVLPSRADLERPFHAAIDRYKVDDLMFTDCRADAMALDRSLARISTDPIRDYAFHVFLEGGVTDVAVRSSSSRNNTPAAGSILALHMGQPVRMQRSACRVATIFVPGALVGETFPDPEAIHGRLIANTTPLTQLIVEQVTALGQDIAEMSAHAAGSAIRASTQLMVSAFGKQAQLSGNARAAARAAMFGRVRRYIQAHLRQEDLSPESVLQALQLPRQTLYRLFQHEGGLGAYIRHLRLRAAADELVRHPNQTVTDIAFGLGFKSSSDFTRAFRRAYDMAPQDFRALSSKTSGARPKALRNEPIAIGA